jgi:Replication initiation factor
MGDSNKLNSDPLATNRGVSPTVSLSIDWISCTFKDSKNLSYPPELTTEKIECKPLNGYNLAARYSDGRIELTHTTRKEMGTHVIMSGGTLKQISIEPSLILSHLVKNGGTIVRLDIAVDCRDCGLKPADATREIQNDRIRTLARQFPLWYDPKKEGYTQYVGKKSSTAYVRIYDKAAEMGANGDWTRVECVFSGRRAMDAAQKCLQGADYRALVRGFVDFTEWREWKTVLSADAVQTNAPRTLSNTKRWLLSSAAPSLARELYLDGDDAFYFQWIEHMRFFLDKLRHEETEAETDYSPFIDRV